MTSYRISLGKNGELIAVQFLKNLGYRIIARNFRVKSGEIDIIAQDEDYLVFVEVKTRSGTEFGTPAEAVNFRKQQQIIKTALLYVVRNDLHDIPLRFDVVSVIMKKNADPEVELFRNAFTA